MQLYADFIEFYVLNVDLQNLSQNGMVHKGFYVGFTSTSLCDAILMDFVYIYVFFMTISHDLCFIELYFFILGYFSHLQIIFNCSLNLVELCISNCIAYAILHNQNSCHFSPLLQTA